MGILGRIFGGRGQTDIVYRVMAFGILGLNTTGKSIFIDNVPPHAATVVRQFINDNNIHMEYFMCCECILRLSNVYNVMKIVLNLDDKQLQSDILSRLRNPDYFLNQYNFSPSICSSDQNGTIKAIVEAGYRTFIDNLETPIFRAHEELAESFMHFTSHLSGSMYKHFEAYTVFTMSILSDIGTLPEYISKAKRTLDLK